MMFQVERFESQVSNLQHCRRAIGWIPLGESTGFVEIFEKRD